MRQSNLPSENAPQRVGAAGAATEAPPPVARLAVGESMPDWIVARLVEEQGLDSAIHLCSAMNRRARLAVRANRLKNSREQLAARLAEEGVPSRPLPLAPD